MISKEFKELVKKIKELGWTIWDVPYNILIDKETLKPKPSTKNLKTFELINLISKLPTNEKEVVGSRRRREKSSIDSQLLNYVQSELGSNSNLGIIENLYSLYIDYTSKLKTLQAKKDRESLKLAKELEKEKLIMSLDRRDIANTISGIIKSMNPYIKRQEDSIKTTFKLKEKELLDEWSDIEESMKNDDVKIIRPSKSIESVIMWSPIKYNGTAKNVKDYIRSKHYSFFNKWFDRKGYSLNTSAKYILGGKINDLISQFQKAFRQNEELKVEVLFHRLIKINPTLRDYTLTSPYNGTEFTLTATNDKGVNYTINTNTITAGGYNIQRLHTRWLVTVRNSQTGKIEKFTIDDKTKS
jgi:hypothetical protein